MDSVALIEYKRETISEDLLIRNLEILLYKLGISQNLFGYKYLFDAIMHSLHVHQINYACNRQICYRLAKIYGVTPISVESSINRVIDKVWNKGENVPFILMLNYNEKKRPNIVTFVKLCRKVLLKTCEQY